MDRLQRGTGGKWTMEDEITAPFGAGPPIDSVDLSGDIKLPDITVEFALPHGTSSTARTTDQAIRQPVVSGLPVDLWPCVFQFLGVGSMLRGVAAVCKEWRTMVVDSSWGAWRAVQLRHCADRITDKQIERLAVGWGHVESLDLSRCERITDQTLLTLSQSCAHLRKIVLSGCRNVTDAGVIPLIATCKHLRVLDLDRCNKITDRAVIAVTLFCPSITSINFSGCTITNDGIALLASQCKGLKSVTLESLRITDSAVRVLCEQTGSSLRQLNLSFCDDLTDESLNHIAQHCGHLSRLELYRCVLISDAGLTYLSSSRFLHRLKTLNLGGCYRLTDRGVCGLLAAVEVANRKTVQTAGAEAEHDQSHVLDLDLSGDDSKQPDPADVPASQTALMRAHSAALQHSSVEWTLPSPHQMQSALMKRPRPGAPVIVGGGGGGIGMLMPPPPMLHRHGTAPDGKQTINRKAATPSHRPHRPQQQQQPPLQAQISSSSDDGGVGNSSSDVPDNSSDDSDVDDRASSQQLVKGASPLIRAPAVTTPRTPDAVMASILASPLGTSFSSLSMSTLQLASAEGTADLAQQLLLRPALPGAAAGANVPVPAPARIRRRRTNASLARPALTPEARENINTRRQMMFTYGRKVLEDNKTHTAGIPSPVAAAGAKVPAGSSPLSKSAAGPAGAGAGTSPRGTPTAAAAAGGAVDPESKMAASPSGTIIAGAAAAPTTPGRSSPRGTANRPVTPRSPLSKSPSVRVSPGGGGGARRAESKSPARTAVAHSGSLTPVSAAAATLSSLPPPSLHLTPTAAAAAISSSSAVSLGQPAGLRVQIDQSDDDTADATMGTRTPLHNGAVAPLFTPSPLDDQGRPAFPPPSLPGSTIAGDIEGGGVFDFDQPRGASHIQLLNLEGCTEITDEVLRRVALTCPRLQSIAIPRCGKITDQGIGFLAAANLPLHNVNISGCTLITDAAVQQLCRPSIEVLLLGSCGRITDSALQAVAKACPNLRELLLRDCYHITDTGVIAVARGCTHLTGIYLNRCHTIRDEGIQEIAKNCPKLRNLDLGGCRNFTQGTMTLLSASCPQLKQFNLFYTT